MWGSLAWQARKAAIPLQVVRRDMAAKALVQLLDTTADVTFGSGHVINIGAGNEWNHATGADMWGNIEAGADLIAADVPSVKSQLHLKLTRKSARAALRNPAFMDSFIPTGPVLSIPTDVALGKLAEYLGIGRVSTFDWSQSGGALYQGDVAWLFLDDQLASPPGWSEDYGRERWLARFSPNDGVILPSWRDNDRRLEKFAAVMQYKLHVLNPNCAVHFTNTST